MLLSLWCKLLIVFRLSLHLSVRSRGWEMTNRGMNVSCSWGYICGGDWADYELSPADCYFPFIGAHIITQCVENIWWWGHLVVNMMDYITIYPQSVCFMSLNHSCVLFPFELLFCMLRFINLLAAEHNHHQWKWMDWMNLLLLKQWNYAFLNSTAMCV